MNRISQYWEDGEHPLDTPEFLAKQRVLRILCLGILGGLFVVTAGVLSTVYFALGGKPLNGNAGQLSGIPIVTVLGAILTLTAVAATRFFVPLLWSNGIRKIATEGPEPPEDGAAPETETDRLWRVYGSGKFVEFALPEAAAIITAVLYHLTADWLMIAFVAGVALFLALRLPTRAANRTWFDAAKLELEQAKSERV